MTTSSNTPADERDDILATLREQRGFLLITVRGIGDEQAARRTTASELTLGGIVKHLTRVERYWMQVMTRQEPEIVMDPDQYRMVEGETLAGIVDDYAAAARETEQALMATPDLSRQIQLPPAPWAPDPVFWSPRRIMLHLIRETAHHSGHADIIREEMDGAITTTQIGRAHV